MDALHLSNQLCFPFYAVSKEITKRYRPLLEPLHLTYPQYLVMLVLWETDQVSLKTIGLRLHLDSGTLTPLINKLISQGYLEKARNPHDERQLVIQLTATGRSLEEKAADIPEKVVTILGLTEQEYFAYQKMLVNLSTKLGLVNEATF
ncbi:MarR family transcriptional regulator [Chryseomicrobium sp. FSL W7-1435]|uniref:MarR family winged helix-turn-helix transcriptional regulator n=1 Tax=Chryseomicrobium sp. FSL W7-1435 TaxID=2921704 RepID=UPI00315A0EE1